MEERSFLSARRLMGFPPMSISPEEGSRRRRIAFITLRRRSPGLLQAIEEAPGSAWRRVELEGVSREYRTPRILDRQVKLAEYEEPLPAGA